MYGCQPFFITTSLHEAQRLIPIIAKGNGGIRCFKAQALEKSIAGQSKKRFAIYFDATTYSRLYPNKADRNVARWRKCMANFLLGYLAAEADILRRINKLKESSI